MQPIDLASYGGISMAVVAVVGAVKKLFPTWTNGKEPMLAVAFSYALGIVAKLTGVMAEGKDLKSWAAHLVLLLLVAAGAGVLHDQVLNKVIKGEEELKK